ncbi:MAG: HAD-IB family phosphatase [Chloroflexota bacterium]
MRNGSRYVRPPIDLIFFDCDSTLSTIEGIDELAKRRGLFKEVQQLTNAAMDGEVHLESVYDRRLQLLQPTRGEIRQLERRYRDTVIPDAKAVIEALTWLQKTVFIVSGGLYEAVRPFGEWLGVPAERIQAVQVDFDHLSGDWWDFQPDQWGPRPDVDYLKHDEGPLVQSLGKAEVVQKLKHGYTGQSLLVGDGMSDIAAQPAVDAVVGFGGVISRQSVLEEAHIFINTLSLAPVLPLVTSASERQALERSPYQKLWAKGYDLIKAKQVKFQNQRWQQAILSTIK